MKNAETVTFGGSSLNRASELRGSDKVIPRDGDLFIIHWRGKFAVDLNNSVRLHFYDIQIRLFQMKKYFFSVKKMMLHTSLQIYLSGSQRTKTK